MSTKIILPFKFILGMDVLGTLATCWQAKSLGEITIEGTATDFYSFKIERVFYNGTDILPLLDWLVETTDYNKEVLHVAANAHVTKMYMDLETSEKEANNYVACLSENHHHHIIDYREQIGVL